MKQLRVSPLVWIVFVGLAWSYMTSIEGRLMPAAAPMQLVGAFSTRSADPSSFEWSKLSDDGPYTAFWVESARLRPECDFVRFEWHLGERGGRSSPVAINAGPAIVRDDGKFLAGPWVATVPLRNFHKTYGDVIHRCRWFGIPAIITTRTRFWN